MDNHIEEVQTEKQDKGFTLVELLIVIVILGILATVTVFAVRGITDQGKASACAADQQDPERGSRGLHGAERPLPVDVRRWRKRDSCVTSPAQLHLHVLAPPETFD